MFSGRAPATSIEELQRKCAEGHGLRISEAMDGAGQALQELIQFSTSPRVEDRLDTVRDFLELLESVEDELTAPAPEAFVHPLDARVNDRLAGGFLMKKRLGTGSTSVALLVERDGKEGVLKVALDPSQNARLIEEGMILRKLRHPNIVELYEQANITHIPHPLGFTRAHFFCSHFGLEEAIDKGGVPHQEALGNHSLWWE